MGLTAIMPTIIIGNIDIELPAIHMTKRFIGTCFMGAKPMSHARYNNQESNNLAIMIHIWLENHFWCSCGCNTSKTTSLTGWIFFWYLVHTNGQGEQM